ncbi:hypothetical protein G7084_01270 [Weissella coleopterorum]|uniref:Competence protein CoiA-like N-terminal domain-containing protein n=1 Tax=Weissella coleopterorum TaxID=2714949 RepID=A0A6G8AYJ2_9LACO|nr:competence protein CoiA family protein [Weissella coleopterorum]QIL50067.1 hypothetical protein G7084_01270 [Weissella coleopterorum]
MRTIRSLNIYSKRKDNRILKISEFGKYVGLISEEQDKLFTDNFITASTSSTEYIAISIHADNIKTQKDLFCPICGQRVYTRLGNKNKHSFSHFPDESCREDETDKKDTQNFKVNNDDSGDKNKSKLDKLQKFRYKVSGQGLANAITQIRNNKIKGQANIIMQKKDNENEINITSIFNNINIENIENLDTFIKNLEDLVSNITKKQETIHKVVDNYTDEELLKNGFGPNFKELLTVSGALKILNINNK